MEHSRRTKAGPRRRRDVGESGGGLRRPSAWPVEVHRQQSLPRVSCTAPICRQVCSNHNTKHNEVTLATRDTMIGRTRQSTHHAHLRTTRRDGRDCYACATHSLPTNRLR